jgi:hypothetical protein
VGERRIDGILNNQSDNRPRKSQFPLAGKFGRDGYAYFSRHYGAQQQLRAERFQFTAFRLQTK